MAFLTILLFSFVALCGATPCATDVMSDGCRDEDAASFFLQQNSFASRGGKDAAPEDHKEEQSSEKTDDAWSKSEDKLEKTDDEWGKAEDDKWELLSNQDDPWSSSDPWGANLQEEASWDQKKDWGADAVLQDWGADAVLQDRGAEAVLQDWIAEEDKRAPAADSWDQLSADSWDQLSWDSQNDWEQQESEKDAGSSFLQQNSLATRGVKDAAPEDHKKHKDHPHLKLAPLAEDNGCAMPEKQQFISGGRRCPHKGACLENNKHFSSLAAAWEQCALSEFCGAVMEVGGSFYLRRDSDPWDQDGKLKYYRYPCKRNAFVKDAIKAEAKVLAKQKMEKVDPLEKFKMKVETYDMKANTKAKVEEEEEEVEKRSAALADEEAEAEHNLKDIEKATHKLLEEEAEEKRQVAQNEAEVKEAEKKAAEEEEALNKYLSDRENLKEEQLAEQSEAQKVDQAASRLAVAAEVEADAKEAEHQAEEEAKKYTITMPEQIKQMEKKVKTDVAAEKLLKVQEQEEEQKLDDLNSQVKRRHKEIMKVDIADEARMLEQEKSNQTVTAVPKFDCMKYNMPIQVLKDGKTGFAFKTLDVDSGEYSSMFSIPFKTTFPKYKDLNGCGINPVDSIAYCTMWTASNKNYVVRVHKNTVEFVARVPVEKFFNTGCFSEDGTYFISDEKANFLIIENVATYKGVRSERNPNLLDWGKMKAVKPKGFHSAYDAVVATANIEGTKQPKQYLIVLSKGSLLIARYEKGTFGSTWDVPYMTGSKKAGWKKGKASDKWGAGWYFSGKIFFAANDGSGVYQVDLSKLDLAKHGKGKGKEAFKMKLAGKSDKSGFNDGTNCLKASDPWLTSIIPFDCEKHGTPLQAIRQDWMGYAIKKLDMTSGAYNEVYNLPFTKTDPPYKFLNAIGMNPLDSIPYGCLLFKDFPAKFWVVRFDGTKFEYVVKVKDPFDPVAGTFNSEGDYFFVHNTNFSHNVVMFNLGKVHELRGFPDKNAKGIKQLDDLRSGIVHSLPLYNFFHFADIVAIKASLEDKTVKEYIVAVNLERQAMFVEWDSENSTNSKITKFGTNDPWAADNAKAYLAFGAAWHYDDRAFFANNDGFGVVEITDVNVENQTLTLEKVGKSTRVLNNDGFNCWNMPNPFGSPPKGIRPLLKPLTKLLK